jgi:hypothetical protein
MPAVKDIDISGANARVISVVSAPVSVSKRIRLGATPRIWRAYSENFLASVFANRAAGKYL